MKYSKVKSTIGGNVTTVDCVTVEFNNGKHILYPEDSSRKVVVQPVIDAIWHDYTEYPPKSFGMRKHETGIITGYAKQNVGTVCEITVGDRVESLHAEYLDVIKY